MGKLFTSLIAGAALGILSAPGAIAAEPLRVCSSTEEPPYSTAESDGFENRLAAVLAKAMGRDLEEVFIDKPAIYLVRDGIDKDLCDVVMGVDAADERVLTSRPYYRTGYAFVSKADKAFQGTRWEDVDHPDMNRFSYRFHSPAETILKYAGKYEANLPYTYSLIDFKSRRNQYINVDAERLVGEVAAGEADMAIAFAPTVARYVKSSATPMRLALIENDIERSDGVVIELQYDQSVGVAKDNPELLKEVDDALDKARAEIQAILEDEGIPLLPVGS